MPLTLVDGTPLSEQQWLRFDALRHLVSSTLAGGAHRNENLPEGRHSEETWEAATELSQDDSCHHSFLTNDCLRRYLVARKWDPHTAYFSLLSTIAWRMRNVPSSFDVDAFSRCYAGRPMEWHGYDPAGRPILYARGSALDKAVTKPEKERFTILTVEQGLRLMEPQHSGHRGVEQWTVVMDESHNKWYHVDNEFVALVGPIMFTNYVERLHRCYVVNPSYLTQTVLGTVCLFLDDRTRSKIVTTTTAEDFQGRQVAQRLLDDLGAENVLAEYGGSLRRPPLEEYLRRLRGLT